MLCNRDSVSKRKNIILLYCKRGSRRFLTLLIRQLRLIIMISKSVLYINMCVKKFTIQSLSCYMLGKIDSIQERELLMPVDTDWVSVV